MQRLSFWVLALLRLLNFACSLDLVFVGFQLRFTTPVFRIATVQSYLVSTLWSFNVVSGTTAPFSCDFSFAGLIRMTRDIVVCNRCFSFVRIQFIQDAAHFGLHWTQLTFLDV